MIKWTDKLSRELFSPFCVSCSCFCKLHYDGVGKYFGKYSVKLVEGGGGVDSLTAERCFDRAFCYRFGVAIGEGVEGV